VIFGGAVTSTTTINDQDNIRDNGNETGQFVEEREVRATVLFSDGTTGSLLGLEDVAIRNFGVSTRSYVFEDIRAIGAGFRRSRRG